ncbi:tetratricopeptide repeat protein [Desulfobacula sp.]|uniref:tetratricopeptide repeat protein n=1 Tax=Desulfobacula sp. TaxID=2593537 RepID=UPI00260A0C68|nr:tetratricopeptide repeat protein [Desulfobacula sp.]
MIETLTLRATAAGNDDDFKTAFLNMELALWMTQSLEKKCLEAVLLNNLGLLYTMQGAWDRAILTFDHSMEIAFDSCTSQGNFLTILNKNISCLFDPKIAKPGDSDND